MLKFIAGVVVGFIIATVGIGGIANMADRGVASAKETLEQQSKEASEVVKKARE